MVNTDSLDLPKAPDHIDRLIQAINTHTKGSMYYKGGSD
jgi:hypothetical protein